MRFTILYRYNNNNGLCLDTGNRKRDARYDFYYYYYDYFSLRIVLLLCEDQTVASLEQIIKHLTVMHANQQAHE